MKLVRFTSPYGKPIAIVLDKITGFTICPGTIDEVCDVFIATGADGPDDEANGWYVAEDYETVFNTIQDANLQ